MIRLSTAIMTHPVRRQRADLLWKEHTDLSPVVVVDPAPDARPSAARTAREAWRASAGGATHHLLLQDDVKLCGNFRQRLLALLAGHPQRVVSLYTDWSGHAGQMLRLSLLNGFSVFQSIGEAMSAVAVVMPADLAMGYADYLDRKSEPRGRDSRTLMDYLLSIGEIPYACAPTLVQHDTPFVPSIWPANVSRGIRRSACFMDDATTTIPVTAPFPAPDALPHLDGITASAVMLHANKDWRGWDERPLLDALCDLGFAIDKLVSNFSAHLRVAGAGLPRILGQAILFEAWLSVRALGTVSPHGALNSTPAAQVALGTLLPGVLRRSLSDSHLASVGQQTMPLLRMAIEDPL